MQNEANGAGKVYVANSMSTGASASVPGSVSVIDIAENRVIDTIVTGVGPVNPKLNPAGTHIYVAQTGEGKIAVIDARTRKITSQITVSGGHPSGLAFMPDGERLVVTLLGDTVQTPGWVQVVTLASGATTAPLQLGAQCERIALTPDGHRAYVSNLGEGTLSVVDLQRSTEITRLRLGEFPFNVLMSPEGDRVYVGNVRGATISVIDTASNRVVSEIQTEPGPNGMAHTPDYENIVVTNTAAGKISLISRADGRVVRTADAGELPGNLALTRDGRRGYIARPYGDTVSVLDVATLSITDTITVGLHPSTLAVCPR